VYIIQPLALAVGLACKISDSSVKKCLDNWSVKWQMQNNRWAECIASHVFDGFCVLLLIDANFLYISLKLFSDGKHYSAESEKCLIKGFAVS